MLQRIFTAVIHKAISIYSGGFVLNKLKIISTLGTVILIPFVISIFANYTTWLGTKSKVEITFKLDGWITIGAVEKSELADLNLIYKNKLINNLLKTSWRVINTGTEGIDSFESGPVIFYPGELKVEEAQVTSTSTMLKIDKMVSINKQVHSISVNNLGIFNPGDYFVTDVYFADIPNKSIEFAFLDKWDLKAKALNLEIKKDTALETQQESNKFPFKISIIFYIGGLIAAFIINSLILKRLPGIKKRMYNKANAADAKNRAAD